MTKSINVKLKDVKRVFFLLEEVNDLFHQEAKYSDPEQVKKFAENYYKEISELYYDVVWDWLPNEAQNEITD